MANATTTTAMTNAASSRGAATSNAIEITRWGPKRTRMGVAFNIPPDGGAAIWFRMNRSLEGYEVAVDFAGNKLQGNISGDLVTAAVPASLYAKPEIRDVYVLARKGAESIKSGEVRFTVQ